MREKKSIKGRIDIDKINNNLIVKEKFDYDGGFYEQDPEFFSDSYDLMFWYKGESCYLDIEINDDGNFRMRYRTHPYCNVWFDNISLTEVLRRYDIRANNKYIDPRAGSKMCVDLSFDKRIILSNNVDNQIEVINKSIEDIKFYLDEYNDLREGKSITNEDLEEINKFLKLEVRKDSKVVEVEDVGIEVENTDVIGTFNIVLEIVKDGNNGFKIRIKE